MKVVFTIGTFDVIGEKEVKLFHEMRKASVPDGKVYVFIYEDYPSYKLNGKFPIQNYSQRIYNLKYFAKNFRALEFEDPGLYIETFINEQGEDDRFTCVMYDDKKFFPGRADIKRLGIPIKFIKYEGDNNRDTSQGRQ